MTRDIIDITRSPSAVDRKPTVWELQDVDKKPVVANAKTPSKAKPLGPAKRVAAVPTKPGKPAAAITAGKTAVVKRESSFSVKRETAEDVDMALYISRQLRVDCRQRARADGQWRSVSLAADRH